MQVLFVGIGRFAIMDNSSLPTNMHEWVQMGHRAAAGIIFIWIGYIFYLAIKHYRHEKVIYWGWIIAFTLVSLQVIAGAFIIFSRGNLFVALSHAFFISCLFGILSYFLLLCYRSKINANMLETYKFVVSILQRLFNKVK